MFKASWNRFKFGAVVSGLLLAGGFAFAQTGGLGAIITSPTALGSSVLSFLPFNAGPQSSVIRASGGTFTANGTAAVTVTNANLTANSVIVFGINTANSVGTAGPFVVTVTPGTGFTVKATSGDTSVYNYWILG